MPYLFKVNWFIYAVNTELVPCRHHKKIFWFVLNMFKESKIMHCGYCFILMVSIYLYIKKKKHKN